MIIKLDDMGADGRINGMGEGDPEGSYVAITCVQYGEGHDEPPQRMTYSISEGMAYELAFGVLAVLGSAEPNDLIERIRREVNAFDGADEETALQAADQIEHMSHALTIIAEWAETADADEAAKGLNRTAAIARGALREAATSG